MSKTVMESRMFLDGKCIVGVVTKKDMETYHVTAMDLDGIVNQLLNTRGVEAAIFLYELGEQGFKASLRSNGTINVARTASEFQGGGHILAAGCTMQGPVEESIARLIGDIEKQLLERQNG